MKPRVEPRALYQEDRDTCFHPIQRQNQITEIAATLNPFPGEIFRFRSYGQLLSLAITNTELLGLSPTFFPTLSSWYCCKNLCSPYPMQMWLVKSGETAVESGEEIKKRHKTWRRNSAARMEKMGMTEELIVTASILLTQTQNIL